MKTPFSNPQPTPTTYAIAQFLLDNNLNAYPRRRFRPEVDLDSGAVLLSPFCITVTHNSKPICTILTEPLSTPDAGEHMKIILFDEMNHTKQRVYDISDPRFFAYLLGDIEQIIKSLSNYSNF